ncbi:MFS transporter [Clostridium sp. SHJSY1]|uniref:MFS transporter n=1 Tax=Clostridium sp. SHJSY1 TaxID=2942483 RepID=UPI0028757EE5|nr:MFS transporter [Clostridium sp. SHJSY1]MDS0527430.1 MFS transporter [Clostridium sp. SHJSY1]
MPLFQKTSYLGAGRYGVVMAIFSGGVMAGYIFSSVVSISSDKKLKVFIFSAVICYLSLIIGINQSIFILITIFIALGGFFNSILNVILISTIQLATPQEMRGKVMAFMSMITQGLTPFAQALGGVLGGVISIKLIISISFAIPIVLIIPFYFVKSFEEFISYDYGKDRIEDVVKIK